MAVKNPLILKLLTKYKEISQLNKISSLLNWDLNVNLPSKASQSRSEQNAYLAQVITEKWHDKEFRALVEKVQQEKNLTPEEEAVIRNVVHATKYYYKVPKDLIVKREQVTSAAFPVWSAARETNEFKKFQPYLEEIFEINKQTAQYLGYKDNPYDALLDQFEPE